uniref:Uncharacterized protein n=1 Tax=Vespula pensylvanica TaxID=30213 RepID=A0A834NRC2_VESPE|nr:hypothetical protein H0235_011133 [Vespula pensylvanica]
MRRGWFGDEVEVRWRRGGGEVAVSSQGRHRGRARRVKASEEQAVLDRWMVKWMAGPLADRAGTKGRGSNNKLRSWRPRVEMGPAKPQSTEKTKNHISSRQHANSKCVHDHHGYIRWNVS